MNKKNIIFFKNTQNPHLKFIEKDNLNDYIIQIIQTHMKNKNLEKVNLLDIGGGKGWGKILYEKSFINYYALDLKTSRKEDDITFIKGDITENNLDLNITHNKLPFL
jgi:2-polyprenyl-3-methyl-5-hydroxy-6-metoxy-1,4-benzoquinol methylase